MPERAEIEAVARALYRDEGGTKDGEIHWRYYETAEKVIEALDRVRDAQGDDGAPRQDSLSDQMQTVEDLATRAGCYDAVDWMRRAWAARPLRSPQGEDHEAALREVRSWCLDGANAIEPRNVLGQILAVVDRALAAPSRDGTVAVEDVVRWLRSFKSPMNAPNDDAPKMWRAAELIEAEFARPAVGEQPEPDALGGVPPSQPEEDKR